VGPSAKKYRGKEDKKKRRNACNYQNTFLVSLGEKTKNTIRVSCTLLSWGNGEKRMGIEGPIGPRRKGNEREGGKARREPLGGIVRYIGSPRQVVFFSCRMTQSCEELPDRISRGGPLLHYKAPVRS